VVVTRELRFSTRGRGLLEITGEVAKQVRTSGIVAGICVLNILHTGASLLVCENADGAVLRDLERYMARLVPDGDPLFEHVDEGADDMPAHVRAVLTHSDLNLAIRDGVLALGTWQGVFVWEHRWRTHERHVLLTMIGV
jgi:secondary thiamine-phosphate synthase enzyme